MQRGRSLQGIVETREEHCTPVHSPMPSQSMPSETLDVAEMPIPNSLRCETKVHRLSPIETRASTPENKEESLPFFDETGGETTEIAGMPVPLLALHQLDPHCLRDECPFLTSIWNRESVLPSRRRTSRSTKLPNTLKVRIR